MQCHAYHLVSQLGFNYVAAIREDDLIMLTPVRALDQINEEGMFYERPHEDTFHPSDQSITYLNTLCETELLDYTKFYFSVLHQVKDVNELEGATNICYAKSIV